MATKPSPADTDASPDLRLIPHADLAQFDTGTEHACQIFHQLTEINPSVRRKVEQHLVVVKSILRIDQLHFKAVLTDLLKADLKRLLLLLTILGLFPQIFFGGYADDRL